jgi:hypothetical protein
MYICLLVKYRYSCQILMKVVFSRQVIEKYSNIRFHENLSSGSRVVPRGQTDGRSDRHGEPDSCYNCFPLCSNENVWTISLKLETLYFRTQFFICSIWFTQRKATISLNSISRLVFTMATYYVLCEVDTRFLYVTGESTRSFRGIS